MFGSPSRGSVRLRASSSGDPSKLPSALIGKPVPQVAFPALEGLTATASPCRASRRRSRRRQANGRELLGLLVRALRAGASAARRADGAKTGVRLIGINYKDQPTAARRFLGRYGNPFTAVGADANGRGAIDWGVYGMPETFVVDGKGEIVYKHVGPLSPEAIEAKIMPAIQKAKSAVAASTTAP